MTPQRLVRLAQAALAVGLLAVGTPSQGADATPGSVVAQAPDGRWSIKTLGNDVYVFRWEPDFYQSLFVVAPTEVLVVDPLGTVAARAYREALKQVTRAPVRKVVYSHSHRDHIAGANELAPGAEIYAHENARRRIVTWDEKDVPVPTRTVGDGDVIRVGDHAITVHYWGPSHSTSLIGLTLETGMGKLLMFVDAIEPGIPPYRDMGDFDIASYIRCLEQASRLDVDAVMGGHTGPLPGEWVRKYRDYITDLLAATRIAWEKADTAPRPGEDGIHANERIIAETTQAAAASIREKYGDWRGYDVWAPMNAQRMLVYIQTGE